MSEGWDDAELAVETDDDDEDELVVADDDADEWGEDTDDEE